MRFLTFRRPGGAPEPGVLAGDSILPLAPAGFPDMLALISGGAGALTKISNLIAEASQDRLIGLASVSLTAPIPRPPKVICVGLNYRDHAIESRMEIPKVPTIFCKFSTAVIGPGENIVLPRNSTQPDYEAEFAFIIGKGGRHIAPERWQEYIFGYTNLNDVSARDFQMATTQWIMGKTFDTFCPMGPWVVTADEISDPHSLDIKISVNGETLQSSNTRHLIFRIPDLIVHLSSVFTLEPGDVVSTGTPAGVGFARKPPRFLKPGDEVVVEVEGLGALRNSVIAEAQAASAD
jgi:2-keto-4-pentenoate hydratase/2-oxohepta-3-ene-1,7-dioic acid hydratase in catechol pathway